MSTSRSAVTRPSSSGPLTGNNPASALVPENVEASDTSELPAYVPSTRSSSRSRRREFPEFKEFSYDAKNRKGKSVVILTVIAERSYSKHIPTFLQDSPVKGRVHLDLDKPESILSVVLNIRGEYLTGANPDQQLIFLDLAYPLWSQSDGDPQRMNVLRETESLTRQGSSTLSARFNGPKLVGQYTWPFCITLPKEVSVPYGKGKALRSFALPQTFNERHAKGSIRYEISLRINRGRFQPNYRIPATIGYIPISRPPPFPPLRSMCYQEGTTLLGPTIDPDGWFSDTPVTIKGTIFSARAVHVTCTLCYTRGSVIPFFMRLESDDFQALDLLSNPKSISVSLQRRIKYHAFPEKVLGSFAKDSVEYVQQAVWWPSSEGVEVNVERFRFLNGELHLKADTKPSSAIADFSIEYSVVLFPFKSAGFEASDNGPLQTYPVEIVTSFAHGPRPRKYAPPGYDADTPPSMDFVNLDPVAYSS
ncbi:hypothetical protein JR316_0005835 [Psilocybe cubensis]|uniref:Uncharacterized protein n=1 Tax=Psilocybe cubensis TaxID=181762 RepID=A0ACB8H0A6_PSICU|nr:hypothetical protein JR316_0005835 [Psilocybe cubensis]KAH9481313.1 hypothetical protein JR316_0005835 [Psilocybe cubensis]